MQHVFHATVFYWLTYNDDAFQFYDIPVNGSEKGLDAAESLDPSIELTGNVIEAAISETTTRFFSFFLPFS